MSSPILGLLSQFLSLKKDIEFCKSVIVQDCLVGGVKLAPHKLKEQSAYHEYLLAKMESLKVEILKDDSWLLLTEDLK